MKNRDYKGLYLKLNKVNDGDIIERLDNQRNKQGYIKELVRTDIALDCFRQGVENGTVQVKENS